MPPAATFFLCTNMASPSSLRCEHASRCHSATLLRPPFSSTASLAAPLRSLSGFSAEPAAAPPHSAFHVGYGQRHGGATPWRVPRGSRHHIHATRGAFHMSSGNASCFATPRHVPRGSRAKPAPSHPAPGQPGSRQRLLCYHHPPTSLSPTLLRTWHSFIRDVLRTPCRLRARTAHP